MGSWPLSHGGVLYFLPQESFPPSPQRPEQRCGLDGVVKHNLDTPKLKLSLQMSQVIWPLGSGGIPNAASGFPPLGHPLHSNPCSAPPGHLTDNHLSDFLKRCRAGLRPNGIVVIKDNMAQEGVIMDDVDSSVCRDLDVVHKIIRKAGLHLLAQERQENFPDEIYHVYTFAMR